MKQIWRLLAILGLLIVSGCGDFDAHRMFESHATSAAPGELTHLRGGKVHCLHCPMYFEFDAKPELVRGIIREHKLRLVAAPPEEARQVEELVAQSASWWQMADTQGQDKVYWIQYNPKTPELETAFRLLVVKPKRAYFVTSGGHLDPEYYAPGEF